MKRPRPLDTLAAVACMGLLCALAGCPVVWGCLCRQVARDARRELAR